MKAEKPRGKNRGGQWIGEKTGRNKTDENQENTIGDLEGIPKGHYL
jgi:hypothetical protein